MKLDRRSFVSTLVAAGVVRSTSAREVPSAGPRFGLVTYLWGQDWNLPTLIRNCEEVGLAGIEVRVGHAHGIEPTLPRSAREEVRRRFADSPVECVGYGSNQEYHSPDSAVLERNIRETYELIRLCHDIGASGVKVKPNALPPEVPVERTIEQIAGALDRIGAFAADYNQKVRLEIHGRETSRIPVIRRIAQQISSPQVGLCWNCNAVDLESPGLEDNFRSVRPFFADTLHVHELDRGDYPYPALFRLLRETSYGGWILFEGNDPPDKDRLSALRRQVELMRTLWAEA